MFAHTIVPHHHHSSVEEAIAHHNTEENTADNHSHHYVHPDMENEQVLPDYGLQQIAPAELVGSIVFSFECFASVNSSTSWEGDPPEYNCFLTDNPFRGPPMAAAV